MLNKDCVSNLSVWRKVIYKKFAPDGQTANSIFYKKSNTMAFLENSVYSTQ